MVEQGGWDDLLLDGLPDVGLEEYLQVCARPLFGGFGYLQTKLCRSGIYPSHHVLLFLRLPARSWTAD
jgi:hypothetical protein